MLSSPSSHGGAYDGRSALGSLSSGKSPRWRQVLLFSGKSSRFPSRFRSSLASWSAGRVVGEERDGSGRAPPAALRALAGGRLAGGAPGPRRAVARRDRVFADISGFTTLTEKLARRGKVGSEEMGDILNHVFGELLDSAYQYGAELLKWGGDAVLLLFRGEQHPLLAAAAAHRMQAVDRAGRPGEDVERHRSTRDVHRPAQRHARLPAGRRRSSGTWSSPARTQVWWRSWRPPQRPDRWSSASGPLPWLTAAGGSVGPVVGPGRLLVEPAPVAPIAGPGPAVRTTDVELRRALPPPIARHVVDPEAAAYEHRVAALCFIEFSGIDRIRAVDGVERVAEAVDQVVSAAQRAAAAHEVTFLATDLYPDGGKVILAGGVPTSYGDDTTRVLAAAREILDSEQVLPLRAGVNVGRVFAGDYGTTVRRVYSVTGDAVNLAARLMAKAGPGELVVSRDALDRTRTRYQVRELEPFLVKGKAQPIEASVVTGAARSQHADSTDPRLLPFVGRGRELDALLDAHADARAGHGSLVDLRGETGIGKSRLVHELLQRTGVEAQWLPGDLYAAGTPYAPFHRIVGAEDLARIVEELAPDLRPMLPLIQVVAGVGVASKDELDQLFGDARKELMEGAASDLLGRMFDFPTVWVFDDVQFMDAASTDLLNRSPATPRSDRGSSSPRPATTASGARPTTPRPQCSRSHRSASATPRIWSPRTRPRPPRPAHRFATLIERAEGNPLFLTELLEAMRVGAVGTDDSAELPDTVESAVAARIDQLTPRQRATLRAASVLGSTVDVASAHDDGRPGARDRGRGSGPRGARRVPPSGRRRNVPVPAPPGPRDGLRGAPVPAPGRPARRCGGRDRRSPARRRDPHRSAVAALPARRALCRGLPALVDRGAACRRPVRQPGGGHAAPQGPGGGPAPAPPAPRGDAGARGARRGLPVRGRPGRDGRDAAPRAAVGERGSVGGRAAGCAHDVPAPTDGTPRGGDPLDVARSRGPRGSHRPRRAPGHGRAGLQPDPVPAGAWSVRRGRAMGAALRGGGDRGGRPAAARVGHPAACRRAALRRRDGRPRGAGPQRLRAGAPR